MCVESHGVLFWATGRSASHQLIGKLQTVIRKKLKSQMKMILSHHSSVQFSEGETGDIWLQDINWTECTLTVPFYIWGYVAGSLVSIKKRAVTYVFNDLTGHNCLSYRFVRQMFPSPMSVRSIFKILCIVFFHLTKVIHSYCRMFSKIWLKSIR